MKHSKNLTVFLALILIVLFFARYAQSQNSTDFKFEVTFSKDIHPGDITGRVFVIITRHNDMEPRYQVVRCTGPPFFGKNINALKAGQPAVVDKDTFGYPLSGIKEIPPGNYYVQACINLYTEFKRSDGHTIWLHNDEWEGQKWNISPGNLYSKVQEIMIDPNRSQTVKLVCDQVIPPIPTPRDTEWVKHVKFKSTLLSEFWGHPMYIGATVLLPKGYANHPEVNYPVNYVCGHFNYGNAIGYDADTLVYRPAHGFSEAELKKESRGWDFTQFWKSDECPRMIAAVIQLPCPYFDTSYGVNSANVGPYGDAVIQELIPYLEKKFRIIPQPYARVLSGGSTGGLMSFALQVFHPDFFGGTWSSCPDPLDFRYYQIVNIYEDKNAYYREYEWLKVERPDNRATDGSIRYMMKDENHYELAIGDKTRGQGQWSIWEAIFSPIGADGYPQPIWDKLTGEIDHNVAEYWRENYDLRHFLEKSWSWIGPKLKGKLHIYTGDMDDYYLDNAVLLMEAFLEGTTDPYYDGTVEYGDRKPHCWGPRGADLIRLFKAHIVKNAPENADPSLWNY